MESLKEKAERLVAFVKILAISSWQPFLDKYPNVVEAMPNDKHFTWDFFNTIAMVWWAISEAKITLSKTEYPALIDIIEESLVRWHPKAIDAYKDLNKFICMYDKDFQSFTSIKETIDFTKSLVGTWLIWNITNKAKLEKEAEIASALGYLTYSVITGYWIN
jgi:hypothetical protein